MTNFVTCPYNDAHRIAPIRLAKHILKCRRSNRHLSMETCPFNATHVVPTHQFKAHIVDCPDNEVVLRSLVTRDDDETTSSAYSDDDSDDDSDGAGLRRPVADTLPMESYEVWAAETAGPVKQGGYDPRIAAFVKPFVRMVPSGLSKARRKTWWVMEKKRVQELKEGIPFSDDVRAVLDIPANVNADTPYISMLQCIETAAEPRRVDQPLRRPRLVNPTLPSCVVNAAPALKPQQTEMLQTLQQQQQNIHQKVNGNSASQNSLMQGLQSNSLLNQNSHSLLMKNNESDGQQQVTKVDADTTTSKLSTKRVSDPEGTKAKISQDEQHGRPEAKELHPAELQQKNLKKQLDATLKNYKNLESENARLRELVRMMTLNKQSSAKIDDVTNDKNGDAVIGNAAQDTKVEDCNADAQKCASKENTLKYAPIRATDCAVGNAVDGKQYQSKRAECTRVSVADRLVRNIRSGKCDASFVQSQAGPVARDDSSGNNLHDASLNKTATNVNTHDSKTVHTPLKTTNASSDVCHRETVVDFNNKIMNRLNSMCLRGVGRGVLNPRLSLDECKKSSSGMRDSSLPNAGRGFAIRQMGGFN